MLCKVVNTNCENTVIEYNGTLVQLPIKNCTSKEIEYGETSENEEVEKTVIKIRKNKL